MTGLLIVNADDFGGNELATERIEACFAAGRITSATAMVYMPATERAAQIARAGGLPVGLHLNLTQPFADAAAPLRARERQARAIGHLAARRAARYLFNPLLLGLMRDCIDDQLERFREVFGCNPTHIDGHNHVHLSPTVLLSLPTGVAIRNAESRSREALGPGRMLRTARRKLIASRHVTSDFFLPIDPVAMQPSDRVMEELLACADRGSLEIMAHPDREDNYRLLMSDRWLAGIGSRRLGSFRDLHDAAAWGKAHRSLTDRLSDLC